jgi:hypothetical protein
MGALRNMRQRNIGWRLDYVPQAERFPPGVECLVVSEIGTSDHAPVVAIPRAPGAKPSQVSRCDLGRNQAIEKLTQPEHTDCSSARAPEAASAAPE